MTWQIDLPIRTEGELAIGLSQVKAGLSTQGIDPHDISRALTVFSELARNIMKYAGRGRVTVRVDQSPKARWLDVIAIDAGPGIADLSAALRDHYSTGGTLGLGLPGVKRMVDDLQIDTAPGRGTTVRARRWLR